MVRFVLDRKCLAPATNPSRVWPDVGKTQAIVRCNDEAAAVDVAETTSKEAASEAVRCRFNGVYMARALAERNKRQPHINAG